ncbi:hypothetical protein H0Z60_07085 [Ectothiorhodospiraceae bacterium WFHF3C12]|nr:hypothetical protein [Ectothiorhodospiraceae bacterium WFHF3C12]
MGPERKPPAIAVLAVLVALVLTGCRDDVPVSQDNICTVLEQRPSWYQYARESEARWGTPVPVLLAFVQFESGFRDTARPPREYLLGVLPWRWQTTAYGYAQAKDGTWEDYLAANPGPFRKRSDMEDALDFIGWYNHLSATRLGFDKTDARRLYLAYHQGRTGYRRGDWRDEPHVRGYADRVATLASRYTRQLEGCAKALACGRWYQFWPFCGDG